MRAWREVFGEQFPVPVEAPALHTGAAGSTAAAATTDRAHRLRDNPGG